MSKKKQIQQELFDEESWQKIEKKKKIKLAKEKDSRISRDQSVFMIENFLKKPPQSWIKEVRIAGILIKKHGWEFWKKFKPDFLVNTLNFYFSDKGKKIIKLKMVSNEKEFLLTKKEEKLVDPNSPKLGDDKKINKTPKSIKDFLS